MALFDLASLKAAFEQVYVKVKAQNNSFNIPGVINHEVSKILLELQDNIIDEFGTNPSNVLEKRHDFVTNISYCGTAPKDSLESSNVWTINKIAVNPNGSTSITTATNVAWTDRLTVIYS
jgi:hypothetical protein